MRLHDHWSAIRADDTSPRVVQHSNRPPSEWLYVAWTPVWEGPARPDYAAALADLNDKLRANLKG
jgi:hypothetical protein